ncbi:4086_t:CDS:1, partial [Gigaspora rosea]
KGLTQILKYTTTIDPLTSTNKWISRMIQHTLCESLAKLDN